MRSMQIDEVDDRLWQSFLHAERQYYSTRMELVQGIQSGRSPYRLLKQAIRKPSERGTALRLLLLLDEATKRQMFPSLVELASGEHADIQLVRDVILSLDAGWLQEHIPVEVERILSHATSYDAYRRLAELLRMIHSPYLATLVAKAAASHDLDVREVAEDFRE